MDKWPNKNIKWLQRIVTIISVCAVIAGTTAKTKPQSAVAQNGCLLNAPSRGVLVDFENTRLFSNRGASQASGSTINLDLSAGTYRITIQSQDNHTSHDPATQDHEQWSILIRGENDEIIASTTAAKDLPDHEDTVITTVEESLVISNQGHSVQATHIAYPSNRANSVNAVCASFELISADASPTPSPTATPTPSPTPKPTPSPTPSPSLTPTPSPTPSPSPSPSPAPEPTATVTPSPTPTLAPTSNNNNESDGNADDETFSLTALVENDQDTTRPGNELTYRVLIKNTGESTIDDLEIINILPGQVELIHATASPRVEGSHVIWSDLGIGGDETLEFQIAGKVKTNTAGGHSLVDVITARSSNKGISATDTDTTIVLRDPIIAGAMQDTLNTASTRTTTSQVAASQDVPISAATGSSTTAAATSTILGFIGLILSRRFA